MLCSTQIANGQGTVGTMPVSTGLQVTQAAIATASSSSTSSTSSSSSSSSISGEPRAKRCKHCDDGVHSTNSTNGHSHGNGIWPVTLDHDLFTTISAVYPDWFKSSSDSLASNTSSNGHNHHHHHHRANQHHHKVPNPGRNHFQNQHLQRHHQRTAAVMAESGGGGGANATGGTQAGSPRSPDSPPKAIVDTSPLQNAMDKNKESLKVKLMLRRPINQLIAQGIMPPLKTPPAFHDQRRQLERAKTGDMLKAKIQQRPARVELERRHILEPTGAPIDPSLVERQRMLKKARLADQLNDQLSHRPGPLELIKKNILHTEEPIEQAVKAGRIPFKATCEGQVMRPQHPNSYVSLEDDSQSSEGGTGSDVIESAAKSAGIVVSLAVPVTQTQAPAAISFAELCQSVSAGLLPLAPAPTAPPAPSPAPSSSLSPLSSLASPATPQTPLTPRTQPSPTPGKDKNRKKSKLKSQPKARTIKFHEYKGPPNAQKSNLNSANAAGETSYEILLQQQQLFLQWQLEWQHKYPQIILPASQKTSSSDDMTPAGSPPSVSSNSQSEIITPIPPKPLGRLEDMKVSDLKAELKRRSLPVSGSKPQLIERLKPFTEPVTHSGHIIMDTPPPHTPAEESQEEDNKSQASPMGSDTGMEIVPESPGSMIMNDDIVQKQQKQIEELQRELTRSQMQLQQVRNGIIPTGQKLALQHHVQARQALKQQQHAAFQNAKNAANLSGGLVLNGQQAALVLNQLQLHKAKLVNGQTGTVANFLGTIPILPAVITAAAPPELVQMSRPQEDTLQVEAKSPLNNHEVIISQIPRPPPLPPSLPQFEETVVRTPDVTVTNMEKSGVKSQIVDDVLEILIKNGELPPSAANDPPTPNCDMNQTPMIHSELSQSENLPSQELSQALSDQMSQELSQALANASQNSISSQPHSPLSGLDALLMAQTPNDLKDLALDLDTLDAVDFSALDMDLDRQTNHTPMEEVEHQQKHITERHHMNEQQLDQNNQAHSGLEMHNDELMDVCTDMHMDMDEPDWLDSLMTTETNVQNANISSMPTVSCNDYISATSNPYDPLLGNNLLHDTFDLFGFSDDFRGAVTDLTTATGPPTSTMSWDKLDFAA